MKDKTIHHPYVSWASDEQRTMFGLPDWSLMGGFSSPSYIMLTRDNQPDGGSISHHGNQLLVCIHNKVCSRTSLLLHQQYSNHASLGELLQCSWYIQNSKYSQGR